MCTVTFIPNRSGFTLTHNRDEAPSRSSVSIAQDDHKQDDLIVFPRDSKAGGTWFATSESGKTVCLLNGAFLKHHHNPPYKRSRGLMVLDFFDYHDPNRFFHEYELDGMEPFTLIFARPGVLTELRWDEHQRHILKVSRIGLHSTPCLGHAYWTSLELDATTHMTKNYIDATPHAPVYERTLGVKGYELLKLFTSWQQVGQR